MLGVSTRGEARESVDVTLRPLTTHDDYLACVRLQRATWGAEYTDVVPASLLKVCQRIGGIVAGAFTRDGRLVGFVYGLTGLEQGRVVHWSHMLAVDAAYRDHRIGQRLKEYQRAQLCRLGIETAYWTFDPLVARNAHLNLNRLGAEVREYVADMYADTGSELHSFGTDRFVVSWPTAVPELVKRGTAADVPAAWRTAPLLNANPESPNERTAPSASELYRTQDVLRIEIPADIEVIAAERLALARAWRASTRVAFVGSAEEDYQATGFFRDEAGRCFHVLTRRAR